MAPDAVWEAAILVQGIIELLLRPFPLALPFQLMHHCPLEIGEQFDVECGIVAPIARQRAVRPIGCRMLLGQRDAKEMRRHIGKADPMQPQQLGGDLGIEQPARLQADLGESGRS